MIKPDAVESGKWGQIIDHIIAEGYKILGAKMKRMSEAEAREFYAVHRERPFYGELVEFMSSGPSILLALEKANAVSAWRETIGVTDPAEAAAGTIRAKYAENKGRNAVHGSDSDENAQKEIAFFFSEAELILNQ
ncbi:MAG: nucleoside-diphosphate kinase [Lentisphaeria bacterium]|nr:nucleoside-diphosphate kinase [Candidatus Neomarinimicrobiota bacterium]MCF7841250.1 nucleoside-diphosphate kinase [Lentisphaeria bacterium]